MTQDQLSQYFAVGLMIIGGFTFFGILMRLTLSTAPITKKIWQGLLWFGSWAIAQSVIGFMVIFASYCENCSEKPATAGDVLSLIMIISPTLAAFLLFLATSTKNRNKEQ